MRTPFTLLIAGAALALGGCATNGLGLGLGYGGGYGPYGGYYDPYYGGYYGSRYGSGYGLGYGLGYGGFGYGYPGYAYGGLPYSGWYDGYYYPGSGYYVYDRDGDRKVWTDRQRTYWREILRRSGGGAGTTTTGTVTANTTVSPNSTGFSRRVLGATRTRASDQARIERRQTIRSQSVEGRRISTSTSTSTRGARRGQRDND